MTCYSWPPPRRPKRLAIAVPGSVLITEDTLELKTLKAGFFGRAAAIYRVDEVILYEDPDTDPRSLKLFKLLLEYMLTAPHLKKKVHPLRRELKAAGLLPPLRLYNHEVPEDLKPGAKVDSFIESCNGDVCKAYLGKPGYGFIKGDYKTGDVITVIVRNATSKGFELEESSWGNVYVGFKVKIMDNLKVLIEKYRRTNYFIILASKYGECAHKILDDLGKRIISSRGALVIFGGPYKCPYEYTDHKLYDIIINTLPDQGTASVRTEEALMATLATLDLAEKKVLTH